MRGLEQAMTKLNNKLPLLGMTILITLSCTSSVIAADVAGHTSGTQKVLSSIPLKNELTATRVLYLLGIVTDARDGLFHGATQQCLATVIQNADGSVVEGRGACDGIDPDGDIWWLSIVIEGDSSSRWAVTGGTGKYDGLAMSGVHTIIAEHADGIVLGRFEGNHAAD
jgi:hypothetical protein